MEKTLIFVRGVDSAYKRRVVRSIMHALNPSPETVTAIRVGMADYLRMRHIDKIDIRAADRTVKNLVKKVFQHHRERFIVIDNETINPQSWASFQGISKQCLGREVPAICIEVIASEENLDAQQKARSNLQKRKRAMFISISPKYIECREDAQTDVGSALVNLVGDINGVETDGGTGEHAATESDSE